MICIPIRVMVMTVILFIITDIMTVVVGCNIFVPQLYEYHLSGRHGRLYHILDVAVGLFVEIAATPRFQFVPFLIPSRNDRIGSFDGKVLFPQNLLQLFHFQSMMKGVHLMLAPKFTIDSNNGGGQ